MSNQEDLLGKKRYNDETKNNKICTFLVSDNKLIDKTWSNQSSSTTQSVNEMKDMKDLNNKDCFKAIYDNSSNLQQKEQQIESVLYNTGQDDQKVSNIFKIKKIEKVFMVKNNRYTKRSINNKIKRKLALYEGKSLMPKRWKSADTIKLVESFFDQNKKKWKDHADCFPNRSRIDIRSHSQKLIQKLIKSCPAIQQRINQFIIVRSVELKHDKIDPFQKNNLIQKLYKAFKQKESLSMKEILADYEIYRLISNIMKESNTYQKIKDNSKGLLFDIFFSFSIFMDLKSEIIRIIKKEKSTESINISPIYQPCEMPASNIEVKIIIENYEMREESKESRDYLDKYR
jgi:hypothetical protein